jgi:hypothetical protein
VYVFISACIFFLPWFFLQHNFSILYIPVINNLFFFFHFPLSVSQCLSFCPLDFYSLFFIICFKFLHQRTLSSSFLNFFPHPILFHFSSYFFITIFIFQLYLYHVSLSRFFMFLQFSLLFYFSVSLSEFLITGFILLIIFFFHSIVLLLLRHHLTRSSSSSSSSSSSPSYYYYCCLILVIYCFSIILFHPISSLSTAFSAIPEFNTE